MEPGQKLVLTPISSLIPLIHNHNILSIDVPDLFPTHYARTHREHDSEFSLNIECQEEWTTTYIFVDKPYRFNVTIANHHQSDHHQSQFHRDDTTNSLSLTFNLNIKVIDQEDNALDLSLNEYTISPSPTVTLSPDIKHSFNVSIHKLSMNHGDSPFRLQFSCDESQYHNDCPLDCSTPHFIPSRVINYKLAITSYPEQLHSENGKVSIFYKDVKPKSNFLCYSLELRDYNGNRVSPPPRIVPIRCYIHFEDGTECPNQKALNLKGRSPGIGGHRRHSDTERYRLKPDGTVCVLLRIEEPSSKYDNRKFKVKFAADSSQITDNLDISPILSDAFLVRTKINKYRLKGKGNGSKSVSSPRSSRKKLNDGMNGLKSRKSESPISPISESRTSRTSRAHSTQCDESTVSKRTRSHHSHPSHPLPPSALGDKKKRKKLCPPVPEKPPFPKVPDKLQSFVVPQLYATTPGNGNESTSDRDISTTVTLPSLSPSDDSENAPIAPTKARGKKRKRKHRDSESNTKRRKVSKQQHDMNGYDGHRGDQVDDEKNEKIETLEDQNDNKSQRDLVAHYTFNETSTDKVLGPMVVESLRTLQEAMGRREYFVSGTECHCYLKCLYCGQTAYPPKEQVVQHSDECLLSMIYGNMTRCVAPQVLQQALHLNADGTDTRQFVTPSIPNPNPNANLNSTSNSNSNPKMNTIPIRETTVSTAITSCHGGFIGMLFALRSVHILD